MHKQQIKEQKMQKNNVMSYDAFFIKPPVNEKDKSIIVGVEDRHIVTVCKEPQFFGLELTEIERIYSSHGEQIQKEGKARNTIIAHLLSKNYVRVRYIFNKVCFIAQIYKDMNPVIAKGIALFIENVKKGEIRSYSYKIKKPEYYLIDIRYVKENSLFCGDLELVTKFVSQ